MTIWVFPENRGTPKSPILMGFSIINHPLWGTPIFGNTHLKSSHSSGKRCGSRHPETKCRKKLEFVESSFTSYNKQGPPSVQKPPKKATFVHIWRPWRCRGWASPKNHPTHSVTKPSEIKRKRVGNTQRYPGVQKGPSWPKKQGALQFWTIADGIADGMEANQMLNLNFWSPRYCNIWVQWLHVLW